MNIKKNLTELIGNTPLLAITRLGEELQGAEVIAKLEYFNPGGSMKDRAAFFLIEDAEKKGLLKPGAMIIEPTSGNTGVGLAWVASVKGYKLVLTMPETMSLERRSLLKALGAQLVLTPGSEGMSGAIRKAEEIREATPGAIILQQFDNPANPLAHEHTTAEEIWRDTDGKVDIFVASVGTGGTLTGTARGLKRHNPSIRAIAVEPASSPVLSGGKGKDEPISEAEAMYRYLVYNGVNPDRLLLEERSTSTVENIAFSKVVMLEYPRKGIWILGFVSSELKGEVKDKFDQEMLNIFIPTTPNPTSGFLIFVPKKDTIELDMKVEDGIKFVISGGLVEPENMPRKKK